MLNFNFQNIKIAFSERIDGDFRQIQPAKIKSFLDREWGQAKNSLLLLDNLDQIIVLDEDNFGQNFAGDAVLSNFKSSGETRKETRISMVVGDCFPLIFFDQKSKNIAMVHAGRKPLSLGILDKVWAMMLEQWQTSSENIWAFLGPGIRKQSYLMPEKPLQADEENWQAFIKKSDLNADRPWQIDLPGFIKYFLQEKDFVMSQFQDSQFDTFTLEKQFFSHRRSQLTGEEDGRFIVACRLFNC